MNMRQAINVTKSLLEMPGLLSGEQDFGLDDPAINLHKARYFDSPVAETIFEDQFARLAIIGQQEGAIGLVSKRDRRLYYYVKFETSTLPATGQSVTQIELWRHVDVDGLFPSITRYVFFEVLLNRYPAIMSDVLHTVQGQQFWRRMIVTAVRLGLTVEMVDLSQRAVATYDPERFPNVVDWLLSVDPWGHETTYQKRRLTIRALTARIPST